MQEVSFKYNTRRGEFEILACVLQKGSEGHVHAAHLLLLRTHFNGLLVHGLRAAKSYAEGIEFARKRSFIR